MTKYKEKKIKVICLIFLLLVICIFVTKQVYSRSNNSFYENGDIIEYHIVTVEEGTYRCFALSGSSKSRGGLSCILIK
jgi:hypothetical protein